MGRALLLQAAIAAALAASAAARVPVFAMLPLTLVSTDTRQLQNVADLSAKLRTLANAQVDGVQTDVWWGIVERDGPRNYFWQPYQQLASIVRSAGLKLKFIMSFHQCGGNPNDDCDIRLPSWAINAAPTAFYTDREGRVDREYISLGADTAAVFAGRTPLQIYSDFMASFRDQVLSVYGDIVPTVEVSMGPAGELRFPSYPAGTFPGVGEFQCYDPFMLASLKQAAVAAGQPEWGGGGPNNAGSYAQQPADTGFWSEGSTDNYASAYGQFFLSWYSNQLVQHADRVLGAAARVFSAQIAAGSLTITGKVAGVHWLYRTRNHAAECTAGYYNTNGNNAYYAIAQVFRKYDAVLCFTALELLDSQQCSTCSPQSLVAQVRRTAGALGVAFAGENALPMYNPANYQQVQAVATVPNEMVDFTYLRLSDALVSGANLPTFTNFVKAMHAL